ncbi:glycosyl hydrolase family 61-domain-containing protein [Xylariales sp. PMI_506]|nr:glycosyl hydrolase family 61-domain-containing protein [Xylariales sp. PMI_506]
MWSKPYFLAVLACAAAVVDSHSFVTNIDIDLDEYAGFWPIPGSVNNPVIAGWNTTASDQGWLDYTSYASPDIICHRNGTNALAHAPVTAGDTVHVQWHGWPSGHKGPVVNYLAACGSSGCQSADKTALEFFKIAQSGLANASADAPVGEWGSDLLIANNNSWVLEIPASLQPGYYVLRTEIISLQNMTTGPQHYPQCLNLDVRGNGTVLPSGGVLGQQLYSTAQPGLDLSLNISTGVSSYLVPGPTLISQAVSVSLSHPVPTATGTVVVVSNTAAAGNSTVTSTVRTATPSSSSSHITPLPYASSTVSVTVEVVTVTITAGAAKRTPGAGSLLARAVNGDRGDMQRRWYHQGLGF